MIQTVLPMILLLTPAVAAAKEIPIFQRDRLAAWCVVPFDSKKRGPVERAEMLNRLGITRLAYDWRPEHIPTFDAEAAAMKAHGIEISAWWMPGRIDETSRRIFEMIERYAIRPQLWTLIDEPLPESTDQKAKVKEAAERIRPLAVEAKRLGCEVGLYNHGGWFGEPANQIAILRELEMPNVGLVYNFHHGHAHIARFPKLFAEMKPHLIALNLNGMVADGETTGRKILQIGAGDQEKEMIRTVRDSGWSGLVGILCHLPDRDAEVVLDGNLNGLERILANLNEVRPE